MKKSYGLWSNLVFLLRRMKQYTRRSFRLIWLSIPVKVALPLIGLLLPNLVVRTITEQGNTTVLIQSIVALGLIAVLCSYWDQYAAGVMEEEQSKLCQELDETELFAKELNCDYENLENKEISGKFDEARENIWWNRRFISQGAVNLTLLGSGIFGFLVYLSVLSRLPVWLLFLMVACTIVSFLFSDLGDRERTKLHNQFGSCNRRMSYLQDTSAEAKAGKDIRLYAMYPWIEERFTQVHKDIRHEYARVEVKNYISALITAGMGIVMEIVAYITLTAMVANGAMTLADYVLCIGAVLGFSTWVRQIAQQVQKLWLMKGDVTGLRECLEMPDRSELLRQGMEAVDAAAVCPAGVPCRIEFDHVTYRYASSKDDTIRDLSFCIEPGERIALVGMNGAGKTTCVKLLCGLLEPTSGEIRINGIPSWKFDRKEYFRLFATVFQDIHPMASSIRENITCCPKGSENIDRLISCLQLADLYDRVQRMPKKEDTPLVKELNDEAVNLSGGEQQRLLLARALYKDSPILVLDEPTAALDPISENNVYQKYLELTKNCTSIFISHRLASTRFCDRIFFLEAGRIAEEGTHEALVSRGGKYAKTFEVQSRYYQEHPQGLGEEIFA